MNPGIGASAGMINSIFFIFRQMNLKGVICSQGTKRKGNALQTLSADFKFISASSKYFSI